MQPAPTSILALLLPALSAAVSPASLVAQQEAGPADRTMVARFSLPDGALDGVTSSDQLVQALRDHLTIELADPLDETLQADLHGWAGEVNSSQPGFLVQSSSLGVRYASDDHLEVAYAIAVRESHDRQSSTANRRWDPYDDYDWDEEAAWNDLVRALDIGLPQSSSEFREPPAGGHVGLRVKSVQITEFDLGIHDPGWDEYFTCCRGDADRALLELRLTVSHDARMGEEDPDYLRRHTNVLDIELEPGTSEAAMAEGDRDVAGAGMAAGAAASLSAADAEALELSENFVFACDPSALSAAVNKSASIVTFDGEQRIGQAVYSVEGDGDLIIVLSEVDEQPPYCLVLVSSGGPPQLGKYEVVRLSQSLSEMGPEKSAQRPFVAALVGEDVTFVTEKGSVEILTVEGKFEGKFDLQGWTMSGGQRRDGVQVIGAFNAVQTGK